MLNYSNILQIKPYSLKKIEKSILLTEKLLELIIHHKRNCQFYANILRAIHFDENSITNYSELPFLPVSIFKKLNLLSIKEENIFKIMTSSGTTGQSVSKIFLDKEDAILQQKVLVKIVTEFISARQPMMIIDSPSVIQNRALFSARGAGILGFSLFATDKVYALNDDMSINFVKIEQFLQKHQGKNIFLFGFTFMIWQHFYKELLKLSDKLDLSQAVLIHGGGWKKLISEAIAPAQFKKCLKEACGLINIHDYYGMVEQTGCIYMECEYGHLHTSIYSDVIIRSHKDFSICDVGEKGIIQVLSILPNSYPGNSLLTEDEGEIVGEDDCPCGRFGKYFKIHGRIKNAEIRGCSDTYASKF